MRSLLSVIIALICSLTLVPHASAQSVQFSYSNFSGTGMTYPAGSSFSFDVTLNFTSGGNIANVNGLSYWINQNTPAAAPFAFAITLRDEAGSPFTDLQTPGLGYPQNMAPFNLDDLGALSASPQLTGMYLVARITMSISASAAKGTYTIGNTNATTPDVGGRISIVTDNQGTTFPIASSTFDITVTAPPTPTPSATPSATPTPTPTPGPVRPLNLSTRLFALTGNNVGIGGFIITGTAPKTVLLRGIGPSLSGTGVNALSDPVLELHGTGGTETVTNNNWRDSQESQIQATGLAPTNDMESAILATLDPGPYTAILRGNNATTGVGLVEVYDISPTSNSNLANISTRAFVNTGDDLMIAGFILGAGTGNDMLIIRGIGPSLPAAISPLPDPTLELRNSSGTLVRSNDNWQDDPDQAAIISAANLAPSATLESAIAETLPPGAYTALLAGVNNGTGVGLVEVYDLGTGSVRRR